MNIDALSGHKISGSKQNGEKYEFIVHCEPGLVSDLWRVCGASAIYGEKVAAIKLVKRMFELDLRTAKVFVDEAQEHFRRL